MSNLSMLMDNKMKRNEEIINCAIVFITFGGLYGC